MMKSDIVKINQLVKRNDTACWSVIKKCREAIHPLVGLNDTDGTSNTLYVPGFVCNACQLQSIKDAGIASLLEDEAPLSGYHGAVLGDFSEQNQCQLRHPIIIRPTQIFLIY